MIVTEKFERWLRAVCRMSLRDTLSYVLIAGAAWLVFEIVYRDAFRRRRISPARATARQVRSELLCSLRSLAVFALVCGLLAFAALSGWTRIYWQIEDYGWGYALVSFGLMVLVHDTYFYWTHRLMHHRWLFRTVHLAHHRSVSPTPWAAYSFSTTEAFVQAGIMPLVYCIMPTHPLVFSAFMIWQVTINVFGHCGYEIFPHCFLRSQAGKFLNSATHHVMHHEKLQANFGIYFNVWDRLMGTNHPDYEERFEQVTGGLPAGGQRLGGTAQAVPPTPALAATDLRG
jgi:Delta7-sterol 5-desaturase